MADLSRENPDHEALSTLARDDPEAFEDLRRKLVGDLIDRAPEATKRRLQGLQFRIDAIHRCSSNSLGATVKIYHLMWQSFLRLHEELTRFREPVEAPRRSAQVLDFRSRKHVSPV
jgi:hypothetical protein